MSKQLKINHSLSDRQLEMIKSGRYEKAYFVKQVQISGYESCCFKGSLDACIAYVEKCRSNVFSALEIYAGVA